MDRWSIELGSVFNDLVFTLGLAYRGYTHRETEVIEAELRETSLVAGQDPLTGLLKRRGLDEWMNAAQIATGPVLFIDIDGFKAINNEGGHAAGDDILSVVARIIHHAVRAQDAVARFGGDESAAPTSVSAYRIVKRSRMPMPTRTASKPSTMR